MHFAMTARKMATPPFEFSPILEPSGFPLPWLASSWTSTSTIFVPGRQTIPDGASGFILASLGPALRVFEPDSPQAHSIYTLGLIAGAVLFAIVLVVTGMVVYALIHFRWPEGAPDPRQYPGNRKIEIIWTAIPCVIVVFLFALTAHAMRSADPPPAPEPDIVVTGHQWWWEMRYPKSGVIVANEIHIPVGRALSLQLESSDVLHPEPFLRHPCLNNRGERAPSRRPWSIAVVLLSVIMIGSLSIEGHRSPWSPNFEPPPLTAAEIGSTNAMVISGAKLFQDKTCLNCHLIAGHGGRRGPELTFVADKLTADNLTIRIVNGGVNMPAFGATLKPAEIEQLVAFLQTRKKTTAPTVADIGNHGSR